MHRVDELDLQYPFVQARMLHDLLRQEGHAIGRQQVATLMRRHGDHGDLSRTRTSQRHPAHRSCPYLLRQLTITRPNHVWAIDITDILMQRGFVYLCAILDWASRRVLVWRLSNTLTTDFCLEVVREAVTRYGGPEFLNTDQGSQFTSQEFTGFLQDQSIQISMDGTGRWRDNVFVVFVERLWRSLKYEGGYLLHDWLHVYNEQWLIERDGFQSPGSGAARPAGNAGGSVTMSMAEARRPIVERSPKDDAHSWAKNVDRRTIRSTGQVKYGDTLVQEIVSGPYRTNGFRPSVRTAATDGAKGLGVCKSWSHEREVC